MALFDPKKLRETLKSAADTVTTAVKDGTVGEAIDAAKTAVKDGAQDAIGTVSTKIKDIKLPELELPNLSNPSQIADQVKTKIINPLEDSPTAITHAGLSIKDALRIFYYLMYADGQALEDELKGFDSIVNEMCPEQEIDKDTLVAECDKELQAVGSSMNPFTRVMLGADRVLHAPEAIAADEAAVAPKLLVWDLFAIAYSDGSCEDEERDLITHIANLLAVDETTVLEMEASNMAALDIEREINWLKTTDQPYLVIEAAIHELDARKAAVMDGVKDLIAL